MHLLSNPRPALPPSQPAAAPPPFSFVRLSFLLSVPPSGRDPQDRPPPTAQHSPQKSTLYLIISLSHYDHRHATSFRPHYDHHHSTRSTSMGSNKRCSEKARAFFPHCPFPDGSPRIISHPCNPVHCRPGCTEERPELKVGRKLGDVRSSSCTYVPY